MKSRHVILALALFGCSGSQRPSPAMSALDRMVGSPAAREIARDDPEAFAELATAVQRARDARDPAQADELAVDAEVTFLWAQSRARVAQARQRAQEATRQRETVETDVARMEQQAQELQTEIARQVEARRATERAQTAARAMSSVAPAERLATAADLRQQAELMVASARLLGATDATARPVEARITAAETAARSTGARPPDANAALAAAGRAYSDAERLLQTTREALPAGTARTTDPVQLTTDLSASGGFEPHRDARGVIAVMRGLFAGPQVAPTSRERVESLARVIRAQSDARVRVEVFVGGAVRPQAEALARTQAGALVDALRRAGAPADRMQAAGVYRLPGGARRDDRVEVVLVLPNEP